MHGPWPVPCLLKCSHHAKSNLSRYSCAGIVPLGMKWIHHLLVLQHSFCILHVLCVRSTRCGRGNLCVRELLETRGVPRQCADPVQPAQSSPERHPLDEAIPLLVLLPHVLQHSLPFVGVSVHWRRLLYGVLEFSSQRNGGP